MKKLSSQTGAQLFHSTLSSDFLGAVDELHRSGRIRRNTGEGLIGIGKRGDCAQPVQQRGQVFVDGLQNLGDTLVIEGLQALGQLHRAVPKLGHAVRQGRHGLLQLGNSVIQGALSFRQGVHAGFQRRSTVCQLSGPVRQCRGAGGKLCRTVGEIIYCLVNNPRFEAAIREKIGQRIDTHELEEELAELQKQLRQKNGAKDKLGDLMDGLDVTDPHYERKYADMDRRMDALYDEIAGLEEAIAVLQTRLDNLLQEKFNVDQVYQFLLYFDKLYAHFTDSEKKKFLNSFIERIEIYPEEQPDGRLIRSIRFKFPVWFGEGYTSDLSWDNETTVSTWNVRGNISTASADFRS